MEDTKSKFRSLFEQIKSEHANAPLNFKREKNSDILVVDGMNNFIRNFTVVPTLNDNGEHVGGVSGFLLSMGYTIKLLKPTRVVVVFDGKGGSLRRRKIFPEYKANRAMGVRVNRAYDDDVDLSVEQKAMLKQMVKLVEFLRELPVSIVCVDHIEADDAIAYIATTMFPESKITIMSGDKDFLQLINERVTVYSPIKKKLYCTDRLLEEYGIHPKNFVYYRCMEGDESDNIGGVNGVALKTARKIFPMLKEAKETSVQEIIDYARDRQNERVAYAKVLESSDVVKRNYQLMQLKTPDFAVALQSQVENSVNNIHAYNKLSLIQKMTEFGMHHTIQNFHVWLQEVFFPLSVLAKS